jgi:hypothetical protein
MADRGWKRPFDDPILLPRGRQLVTLEDAATYIMKLPKAEQDLPEWQTGGGLPDRRRRRTRLRDARAHRGAARFEPQRRTTVNRS